MWRSLLLLCKTQNLRINVLRAVMPPAGRYGPTFQKGFYSHLRGRQTSCAQVRWSWGHEGQRQGASMNKEEENETLNSLPPSGYSMFHQIYRSDKLRSVQRPHLFIWYGSPTKQWLDIVGTVYHLAIYMQSNKIHSVFNDWVYSSHLLARHVSGLTGPSLGAFSTSCMCRFSIW